ncbi:DUF4406 domain-containing protein [Budviciaceae bacterium BWR-B9]|uniref:DUF4406 domain-containing protein n=1 Tax=Limnobaculum allomyrinae TaxID=2791986 RepID=A0ABS1IVT4_9GAMM|nr:MULTISPECIES: DUF4406 domain-containing protein [Limnobaculum]MBK5145871.1 DUF4406 domain-containing protein [Limnobaculum allomyrinae]MBV7693882.1 DUF4406 domain-containing protein [Limnobaculum sp. M2-1]
MKIYIAGPMSGRPNFNRPAFYDAAKDLTDQGYIVLNPATLPNGLTEKAYMDIGIAMLLNADTIYLLNGWKASAGALAELALAEKIGLVVIYQGESG